MAKPSFQPQTKLSLARMENRVLNKCRSNSRRLTIRSQAGILGHLKIKESKLYLTSVESCSPIRQIPRRRQIYREPGSTKRTHQSRSSLSVLRAPTVPLSILRLSFNPLITPPPCLWVKESGRLSPNHMVSLASIEESGLMSLL